MSLYASNYINHKFIGDLRVTRIKPPAIITGDENCLYEWSYLDEKGNTYEGTTYHRYNEGAPELLARVYIDISGQQND